MKFIEEQIDKIDVKSIQITRYQVSVFVVNMVLIFAMVVLQHMHLKPPAFFSSVNMTSPIPQKEDIMDSLIPKLELKENNYQIKKQSSLIPVVSASGDFDQATSYIVLNYDTGEVLAEKNSRKSVPIASLTKIMTSVVALDLANSNERFTVNEHDETIQPTKIGVVSGQSLTLDELLEASLMTSANDAVEVIKDGINSKYSADVLVRSMNEKAQFLGMNNTHFTNPQGFDDQNPVSSAEDLAVLSHYALTNYPQINKIVKQDYVLLPENQFHKQYDLYNWNGLLDVYPGVFGIKIGNTDMAGTTMVVGAEREGKKVLVVLLGAPGVLERDLWASQLLDTGFEELGLSPVSVTKSQLKEKYSTWKYWNS